MSLRLQTITLAISNIGTALLSFLLAALIARVLGERGLGAYAVSLAWVMPLSLLVEFGIGTLITREIASVHPEQQGAGDEYGGLIHLAVRARVVMGLPLAAALVLAAPLLSMDAAVIRGIQVSAPLVVIQPLFSTYSAVFRGRGWMVPIPWLNVGMLVVQLVLTAAVLLPVGERVDLAHEAALVVDALAINTFTSAGQLAACWGIYRTRFYTPARAAAGSLRVLLRESWNFGLAAVFAAVQMRMSAVLLEALSGVGAAGLFAGANRFVEAARLLPNAYFGALFPRLGALASDREHLRHNFLRALGAMALYGMAVAGGLALLAQPLLNGVYGAAFVDASPALVILGAAFALSLLRGTLTLYRYAQRREAFVNKVNLGVIVVQVALSLWLIPAQGITGAAWAVLGAEASAAAMLAVGRARTGCA
jgi:O-antigen/teichoic acid export membrane protein